MLVWLLCFRTLVEGLIDCGRGRCDGRPCPAGGVGHVSCPFFWLALVVVVLPDGRRLDGGAVPGAGIRVGAALMSCWPARADRRGDLRVNRALALAFAPRNWRGRWDWCWRGHWDWDWGWCWCRMGGVGVGRWGAGLGVVADAGIRGGAGVGAGDALMSC